MSEKRDQLAELISTLRQQRDELALQVHLGKAEAREEWDLLAKKLDKLMSDYEPVRRALGESKDNVLSALMLVTEEIRTGFERIRNSL